MSRGIGRGGGVNKIGTQTTPIRRTSGRPVLRRTMQNQITRLENLSLYTHENMDVETRSGLSQQETQAGNFRLTRSQVAGIHLQTVQNQGEANLDVPQVVVDHEDDVETWVRNPIGRGGQVDLTEWLDPIVPGPLPTIGEDFDGWAGLIHLGFGNVDCVSSRR